jgi:hypothetical protein
MKKHMLLIAVGLGLILSPFLAAHPPDSLRLELDSTGTLLTAKVFHHVKSSARHFIINIEVKVNGQESIRQTYAGQLTDDLQEGIYKLIQLKPEDKIEVTGVCSITGKKTAVLTVPKK